MNFDELDIESMHPGIVCKMHGFETRPQHNTAHYLGYVYAKIWVLSRHVCIVFTSNQQQARDEI